MNRAILSRSAFAIAICGAFLLRPAYAADAAPAPAPDHPEALHAQMERHLDEKIHARLARLADRLEIKASQQPAWQKFSAAWTEASHGPAGAMAHRPGPDADAATLTRTHAEFAARHAQVLARLADATAELEQALGPDQRKVFDEVARQVAHEHMMGGHGEGHAAGMHHSAHEDGDDHCEGPGEYGHPGDPHEGAHH
jgi:hypothetical protein